jgi:hypothetical protein
MFILCAAAGYKAIYSDDAISAELAVEDNDWVILTVRNNSASQIQLLADKSHYSNTGKNGENTILVPYADNMNPGTRVAPIPIAAGRAITQRFVAPGYVQYKKGKVDNVDNWTPRNKNLIKTATFSFEYEIEGETKQFYFDGDKFVEGKIK